MRKMMWLTGVLLLLAVPAIAQDTPKAEVFAGGSYIRSDGANFRGWNASVAGNLNDWFGIVGDFSGHYFPPGNFHIYTYTFGPQLSYRKNTKLVPFAHALFGGARVGSGSGGFGINGFAANLGGGIDWVVHQNLGIRLIQADALITRFSGSTSTEPRLSFGVVFRFGR